MPFPTEALTRRQSENDTPGRSGTLRKLVVFQGLSPMLFACLGISGLMCASFLGLNGHPLLALPYIIITIFSGLRYWHWHKVNVVSLSEAEQKTALRFIRFSALVNAPLMSACACYLILTDIVQMDLVLAGWMTMMACITGISLCSLPVTARMTMITLLLPPNVALLWGPDMSSYLFGVSMIVLSLFCMGTFGTVLKLIRNLTDEAEENAAQRGWIAATMRDFLEMSRDVAWEVDGRIAFTQVSASIKTLTGRDADSLIGTQMKDLIDFSDKASRESSRAFGRLKEARASFQGLVFCVKHADGRRRYISVSGTPIFSVDNAFAGYRGLIADVTTRIEDQLALQESEERFRDFAELAAERLWETDENHCFTYVSESGFDHQGAAQVALIGLKAGAAFEKYNTDTDEGRRNWEQHFETIRQQKQFKNFVIRDNLGRILSLSGRPVYHPDGTFRGYRGYTREITAEHQAHELAREAEAKLTVANRELEDRILQRTQELQEKTDLLQEIFDTMGESLVVLDRDLSIVMVNEKPGISLPPGAWEVGGDARVIYSRAHKLGLYRDRHVSKGNDCLISDQLMKGVPLRLNRIDTSGQHISENFYPRKDGGYVVLYTDITREAKREEELRALSVDLRRSKEAAEAASRTKSEFLANMSHEIRTPMNGILGMTEILMSTELSSKQRDMTRVVMRSADSLLTIINDILDFSKLEAGKMTFVTEGFDLNNALDDVTGILSPKAAAKNVTLDLVYDGEISGRYVGDVGRLRQVITNLAGNAVKFTEQGTVTITVSEELNTDRAALTIAVTDTGCGIPADKLERIFNKFEQVDGSSSRQYEGTGLGLSISRRIAEMMGGSITVDSEVGKGSVFTLCISLPLDRRRREPEPAQPEAPEATGDTVTLEDFRILIAEDNLVNQMVLKTMLEPVKCQIHLANNGEEAVELFSSGEFDLIFMDVSMPVMDGLQATGRIKQIQARTGRHVPVIGITAHAMREDKERCIKAGMDDYLPKPVRKEAVMEKISTWYEQKRAKRKTSAA